MSNLLVFRVIFFTKIFLQGRDIFSVLLDLNILSAYRFMKKVLGCMSLFLREVVLLIHYCS